MKKYLICLLLILLCLMCACNKAEIIDGNKAPQTNSSENPTAVPTEDTPGSEKPNDPTRSWESDIDVDEDYEIGSVTEPEKGTPVTGPVSDELENNIPGATEPNDPTEGNTAPETTPKPDGITLPMIPG